MKLKKKLVYNLIFLTLVACQSENKIDENKTVEVTVDVDNNFNNDQFDFILPQPLTLANAFKTSGLSYYPDLTNPISNKDNYAVKSAQILNFGVYSADLAYCIINSKQQEALKYFKTMKEMSVPIGLGSVFSDKEMIKKFENSLNDPNQLQDMVIDIQEKTDDYLADKEMRYIAAVQFAGAWTEGMYLGIADMRKKPSENLGTALVDQMTLLQNTIKGIKAYPGNDQLINDVTKGLEDIFETYESFESVKKANAADDFVVPILSNVEFETLAEKIVILRNKITK